MVRIPIWGSVAFSEQAVGPLRPQTQLLVSQHNTALVVVLDAPWQLSHSVSAAGERVGSQRACGGLALYPGFWIVSDSETLSGFF